ncbi:MAG: uridylate kinase [Methylococcaceae bacterium]|nr:uridylate kinase [Methylococcaceae bacterium]
MTRVIKLGGSLLEASVLPACLDVVERLDGRVLIVPGGGVFAEQVRIAQNIWRFDDVAAHRMAILAMRQMALLFNSLKPNFALFETAVVPEGLPRIAIWSPRVDELDNAGIEASWDITSDSLAAWLAGRMRAVELVLVKSAAVDIGATLAELQRQGIVDAAFNRYAERLSCQITVINKDRFLSGA